MSELISEVLVISERVAIGDQTDRISEFDLISTPRAPTLRVSYRIPGSLVSLKDTCGESVLGQTTMAKFSISQKDQEIARMEINNLSRKAELLSQIYILVITLYQCRKIFVDYRD